MFLTVLGRMLFGVVSVLALVGTVSAHEIRPAYLQIDEMAANRYKVVWRTPILSGMRLPVVIRFSRDVRNVTEPAERSLPDSLPTLDRLRRPCAVRLPRQGSTS